MDNYRSGEHSKYLLQYHLIFTCKYRRKLLLSDDIIEDVKKLSNDFAKKHDVIIHCMETDKDHIHYMIETTPNINLAFFTHTMKLHIAHQLWIKYTEFLNDHLYDKDTFFSDGYFISSIGNVNPATLSNYIKKQGQK